jgi:hypothetical protein
MFWNKEDKPMTMPQAVAEWQRNLQAAIIQARLNGVYVRVMIDGLESHVKALRISQACQ